MRSCIKTNITYGLFFYSNARKNDCSDFKISWIKLFCAYIYCGCWEIKFGSNCFLNKLQWKRSCKVFKNKLWILMELLYSIFSIIKSNARVLSLPLRQWKKCRKETWAMLSCWWSTRSCCTTCSWIN